MKDKKYKDKKKIYISKDSIQDNDNNISNDNDNINKERDISKERDRDRDIFNNIFNLFSKSRLKFEYYYLTSNNIFIKNNLKIFNEEINELISNYYLKYIYRIKKIDNNINISINANLINTKEYIINDIENFKETIIMMKNNNYLFNDILTNIIESIDKLLYNLLLDNV
tara:strand:- start:279 stop:785 length:507 start_codon:yes stop_codon:yes gene_type:complete